MVRTTFIEMIIDIHLTDDHKKWHYEASNLLSKKLVEPHLTIIGEHYTIELPTQMAMVRSYLSLDAIQTAVTCSAAFPYRRMVRGSQVDVA